MDAPTTRMEWALWLASKGFYILQLSEGSKTPKRGFGWLKASTDDAEKIRAWFEEDPAMNYGVCPGEHHVILDLDDKPWENKDGVAFLIGLELENQDIPPTLTANSPSGGKHLYFHTPVTLGNAHSFPKDSGIDVRGAHGYVVGPGCELIEGKCKATDVPGEYVIEDSSVDISDVPNWLLSNYLREKRERDEEADTPLIPLDLPENLEKAEHFLAERAPAIQGRSGNEWTLQTACWLRDFGLSEDKALEVMLTSDWNERCEPPWDWDELSDVVEHAYRYGQNRPGAKGDMLSMYERLMGDVEVAERLVDAVENGSGDFDGHFYGPDTFTNRGMRREYIVPNWLPAHGFTALLAKRSMGKSTIMLDLACRVACDLDWQGLPIKEGYVSIYLCGEDDEGLELNMVAWQKEFGEIPADRMIIADIVANLMSAEDVEKWAKKLHKMLNGRKAVVFLDTWQRATSTAGQNKDEDMNLCVHHAEALAASLGGPLVGAFHPPKYNSETIHGSAVIENASTAIWVLENSPDGGKKLRVERMKGPGYGQYRLFKFQEVELEEKDAFGNNQKGLVPIKFGGSEDKAGNEHSPADIRAREAWAELIRGVIYVDEENPEKVRSPRRNQTQMANELLKWMKDEKFMERFGEKAKELDLRADLNPGSLRNKLRDLFWTWKDPYVYDDMYALVVDYSRDKRAGELAIIPVEANDE